MATTQLSDVYNPLTFGRIIQEQQLEKNAFFQSGIVVPDPLLQNQANQGGTIGELTQFAMLAVGEPNYSNDNPADKSTPKKVTSQKMRFRVAPRNESWSTMNLARELNHGSDPAGAITGRIGHYWATDDQRRLVESCRGILASNIADNSGDMLIDVSNDSTDPITGAQKIGAGLFIDASQTMGDRKDQITTIAMHSIQYAELQHQQLIEYVKDAENNVMFPTYLGKRVIQDDSLPVEVGANRNVYTSILFGGALFATANGKVSVPSELDRNPDAGNGSGEEIIYSRVSNILHPNGFSFTSDSVAGEFAATYAELAQAANWERVQARKNIPLAFIKTNG